MLQLEFLCLSSVQHIFQGGHTRNRKQGIQHSRFVSLSCTAEFETELRKPLFLDGKVIDHTLSRKNAFTKYFLINNQRCKG
jgi:hypothetical protein